METIYNWLLENTGNAGHYYTVLNTHRQHDSNGSDSLEIMARRSADFSVVNLVFVNEHTADGPDSDRNGRLVTSYLFSDEQQVIDYIATGTEPQASASEQTTGVRVLVVEPGGEAATITFPHEQ
ncbi:hypothetical protein [Spirosoma agri]|uniref:Uncharacterized protein n=1 Tax=Spirosoma agri TaxID=1987381 RepID=A0A6M0IIB6_9BACT|nr:hypothetical protein [Spirosoma agri]NEU68016.1 hypothetical protein [Spirosoma agri]